MTFDATMYGHGPLMIRFISQLEERSPKAE